METLKDKITKIITDTDFNLGETAEHSANRILELPELQAIQVQAKVKPEIAGIDKGLVTNLVGEIENDWQMGGFGGTIYEDFARELLYRYLKEKQFSV